MCIPGQLLRFEELWRIFNRIGVARSTVNDAKCPLEANSGGGQPAAAMRARKALSGKKRTRKNAMKKLKSAKKPALRMAPKTAGMRLILLSGQTAILPAVNLKSGL